VCPGYPHALDKTCVVLLESFPFLLFNSYDMNREHIDIERPVITGLATYPPDGMRTMSRLTAPHMNRGIEFGVGRGSEPVSNFPGWQTVCRPFTTGGGKMRRVSPNGLGTTLTKHVKNISRVTIKTGVGTDLSAVKDVLKVVHDIRAAAGSSLEIVLSSQDPNRLREMQQVGLNADTWQQTLHWTSPLGVREMVKYMLAKNGLIDGEGAEVSFPLPLVRYSEKGDDRETQEIAQILGDAGRDSHLAPISMQWEVNQAISALGLANFALNARETPHRLRGFYVRGNPDNLDYDIQAAQLLGPW